MSIGELQGTSRLKGVEGMVENLVRACVPRFEAASTVRSKSVRSSDQGGPGFQPRPPYPQLTTAPYSLVSSGQLGELTKGL